MFEVFEYLELVIDVLVVCYVVDVIELLLKYLFSEVI